MIVAREKAALTLANAKLTQQLIYAAGEKDALTVANEALTQQSIDMDNLQRANAAMRDKLNASIDLTSSAKQQSHIMKARLVAVTESLDEAKKDKSVVKTELVDMIEQLIYLDDYIDALKQELAELTQQSIDAAGEKVQQSILAAMEIDALKQELAELTQQSIDAAMEIDVAIGEKATLIDVVELESLRRKLDQKCDYIDDLKKTLSLTRETEEELLEDKQELRQEIHSLHERIEDLELEMIDTYAPLSLPFQTTIDQICVDLRPAAELLMGSRFERTHLPDDIPNELSIIINSRVNETGILTDQTFEYRVWESMNNHMRKMLKTVKATGRYEDCPDMITTQYMQSVIGLSKESFAEYLY